MRESENQTVRKFSLERCSTCGLPVWVGDTDAEFLARLAGKPAPKPECWNYCDVDWVPIIVTGKGDQRAWDETRYKRLPLNQSEPHTQIYKGYPLADRKHSYGKDRVVVYTAPQGWPDWWQ